MIKKKLTLVVPAYNEELSLSEYLPLLITECNHNNWELIVIDDGSEDDTYELLKRYNKSESFTIIRNKLNKGYGSALKSGISVANTKYVITLDADGQHKLNDVHKMIGFIEENDADMVVGRRDGDGNLYRTIGKKTIRFFAKRLMQIPIKDLNSGMKIYKTELVKEYLKYCPNGMAFSDIITLLFIYNRHLVLEIPIGVDKRKHGKSNISYRTGLTTLYEILNIVLMFNPIKIFMPTGLFFILGGMAWGIPIVVANRGISVGASLSISVGILIIFFGLLAEQISQIRKKL